MQWVSLAILMFFPVSSTPSVPKPQGQKQAKKKIPLPIRTKAKTPTSVKKAKKNKATSQRTKVKAVPVRSIPERRLAAKKAIPTKRRAPVTSKKQKASKPLVRSSAKVAKKAVPNKTVSKKSNKKSTSDLKQPSEKRKESVPKIPYIQDKSVSVQTLKNGFVSWCKAGPQWNITQVRVAIAAGTASDPKGLYGTARFLARLLEKRINQPKNPPHSLLPPGGNYYKIKLDKDWVEIRAQVSSKKVPESLLHLAKVLRQGPGTIISEAVRKSLQQSTTHFPPPSLTERVEQYLFAKQARGHLLRGAKKTFNKIGAFRLQTSHKELYLASRMRLLIVGHVDCGKLQAQIKRDFHKFPKSTKKEKQELFFKSSVRPSGRILSNQELIQLYQLPKLQREDYLPLYLLKQLAKKEVQRSFNRSFGRDFPLHANIRTSAQNGYMLFALPSQLTRRKELSKQLKEALGNLRMSPYHPTLKQRLQSYRQILLLQSKQERESSEKTAEILFAQLQLPSKKYKYPRAIQPIIEKLTLPKMRELARLYMGQSIAFSGARQPFSLQRVILFIGTLLLVWVLLDQTFRRSRKNEE